jgi:hypothetical protein
VLEKSVYTLESRRGKSFFGIVVAIAGARMNRGRC